MSRTRLRGAAATILVLAWPGRAAPQPPAYEPDEHTLLLYHFDGDGDEMLDASSQELRGTLNEGPVERGEGIFGSSLKLADGQVIQLEGNRECLRGMDQLTAELWFKTTNEDTTHRQRLILFWEHYLISIFEGQRFVGHLYDADGKKAVLRGSGGIRPGVWYHAALTYDGQRGRLWLNGTQVTSVRLSGPLNNAPGALQFSTTATDAFIGEIDEVRISNVARTSFPAARQRNFVRVVNDLALSPGAFRVSFLPLVPAGAEAVTCAASLDGAAPQTVAIGPDQLKPLEGEPWLEGEGQVVLPVPEGVEGSRTLTCTSAYTSDGREHSVSQDFPVEVEPMIPAPATEFRAAWTHSHRIEDPEDIFSRMAAGGLNAAIMRVRRGETAYFDSKLGPLVQLPFDNDNFMEETIAAAERHGIDLHAYVNNFPIGQPKSDYAQQLRAEGRWQKDPDGNDLEWMCPSEPRNVELVKQAMVELAREYPVKGVQYDFIRYPSDRGCYCDRCRAKFEERIGKQVENWPQDVLRDGALYEEYTDARCEHITNAVRITSAAIREVNPDIVISAAVFAQDPEQARHGAGQDWLRWCKEGLLDALCPMSYVYDTAAYEQTVQMILEAVDGAVPVYAGIGVRSSSGRMKYPEELAAKLNILRRLGAPGFAMFCVTPTTDVPENILMPLRDSVLEGDGRG